MSSKRLNALSFRNRCPSLHLGDDQALGDIRKGILQIQRAGGSAKELTPGTRIVGKMPFSSKISICSRIAP